MGKLSRSVFSTFILLAAYLVTPAAARAEAEATFVVGGLLGGSFVELTQGDFSLESTFENGTLFGGRLGWYGFPLGVEGSFIYSGSGLTVDIIDDLRVDAKVMYGELNALLIILPGPIPPIAVMDFILSAVSIAWEVSTRITAGIAARSFSDTGTIPHLLQ